VLVRLLAGGICGSDLPSFIGRRNTFVDFYGEPGYPLHEVVGEVVSGELPAGTRIVGWAEHHLGLAEYFVARLDAITVIEDFTDVEATVVQPLCTVLHQLDRIPDIRGKRAAVIGQGSIGLLFSHALKARGAAHVTGVDRVDRSDVADAFGVDEVVSNDAAAWAKDAEADIVVEAVGHHAGPLEAAVDALAPNGTVLAFGVPDETHYAFPFKAFFRKHATLIAGAATDRAAALARAHTYLLEHPALLDPYVTTVVPVHEAQRAFETALSPGAGQIKVVLDGGA
jgi:threonine dehydrogenase-like Zn-dependent dehydrogenase